MLHFEEELGEGAFGSVLQDLLLLIHVKRLLTIAERAYLSAFTQIIVKIIFLRVLISV